MTLPEVQEQLKQIQRWMRHVTDELDLLPPERDNLKKWTKFVADKLAVLIAEMDRRPLIKKARPVSRTMTAALEKQAREMYLNGDLTMHEVGERLGINAGRVSEAVRGKRT